MGFTNSNYSIPCNDSLHIEHKMHYLKENYKTVIVKTFLF
jgi:hypothetical protein